MIQCYLEYNAEHSGERSEVRLLRSGYVILGGTVKVLYTGSFNPFHAGHQYVFDLACRCFGKDNVWIGVAQNKAKPIKVIDRAWNSITPITRNVIVYEGLTAETVRQQGFDILVRGIRPGKSLEQEEDLCYWNKKLGGVDTLLIPTPPEVNQISSSVIRELDSYGVTVLNYMNPDVYWRYKIQIPQTVVYFGKSCVGKSTLLSKNAHVLNTDKRIWDFADLPDKQDTQNQFAVAFTTRNKDMYDGLVRKLGESVDWGKLFGFAPVIDAAVIGVYWKYIPAETRCTAMLVKCHTSEENRQKFATARGVSTEFLASADFFYQDPPYWDEEREVQYV